MTSSHPAVILDKSEPLRSLLQSWVRPQAGVQVTLSCLLHTHHKLLGPGAVPGRGGQGCGISRVGRIFSVDSNSEHF